MSQVEQWPQHNFCPSIVLHSDILSLTEAPLPDPTLTPPNGPETDPKRTRNGAETEPKRSQTEPKWTEIKPFRVGRARGLSGYGGGGGGV